MKRYELENIGVRDDNFAMMENADGDFVKFEDVEVLLAELNLLRSQAANRPEGRDTLAAKFADRMMTELQTDLGVHHDEPFLRMSRLRLRELVEAIKGLLDERGPQEGSGNG